MGKKASSILKGINASEIVTLLNKAYADEWLAYYQYFVEAKVVKGIMKDAALAELTQHATDELRHANLVSNRIIQLGGTPILHPDEWIKMANCKYEAPTNPDVMKILEQAINGERCAIETYSKVLDKVKDKDIVTYEMITTILTDEVEHEEDLQSLLEDIEEFIKMYKS
ncbi:MAG: ferritin-like domain-containing protein [Spirochaetota bacterium]|nr:ferritin-like domain-containing protein [Spirochaetota bacterium]